eukprot:ctg_256.g149
MAPNAFTLLLDRAVPGGRARQAAWSPAMDVLALLLDSGAVVLVRLSWQWVGGLRPDRLVPGERGCALAWSPDGRQLAVGLTDGRIILYGVEGGTAQQVIAAAAPDVGAVVRLGASVGARLLLRHPHKRAWWSGEQHGPIARCPTTGGLHRGAGGVCARHRMAGGRGDSVGCAGRHPPGGAIDGVRLPPVGAPGVPVVGGSTARPGRGARLPDRHTAATPLEIRTARQHCTRGTVVVGARLGTVATASGLVRAGHVDGRSATSGQGAAGRFERCESGVGGASHAARRCAAVAGGRIASDAGGAGERQTSGAAVATRLRAAAPRALVVRRPVRLADGTRRRAGASAGRRARRAADGLSAAAATGTPLLPTATRSHGRVPAGRTWRRLTAAAGPRRRFRAQRVEGGARRCECAGGRRRWQRLFRGQRYTASAAAGRAQPTKRRPSPQPTHTSQRYCGGRGARLGSVSRRPGVRAHRHRPGRAVGVQLPTGALATIAAGDYRCRRLFGQQCGAWPGGGVPHRRPRALPGPGRGRRRRGGPGTVRRRPPPLSRPASGKPPLPAHPQHPPP